MAAEKPTENRRACCFTGYRPHRFPFAQEGLRPEHVQAALGRQIRRLYDEGYRTFITGMCVGVDLWAASEVLALQAEKGDVRLIAAVPFEGQESRWTLAQRRQYRRVLAACAEVHTLFTPEQANENAAACYRKRNEWMVDRADTVIAVYTPIDAERRSGTAATVRYARRKLKRIVYIHPTTLAMSEETVQQIEFSLE
ncbi:MAG: DUF1273 family protein [Clostridia bacterium]|nr:DUF1273 family protein [Clostridia bacterium]